MQHLESLSASFKLDPTPDLARTLGHARMGSGDPSLRILSDGVWRATRTPLGVATQRLRLADSKVHVEAWGPGAEWLITRAERLCGSLDDPSSFTTEQPLLKHLARSHPGLRMGRTETIFETAMLVTLEQRVATRDAWGNWRALVHGLGEPAPGPLNGLFAPPSPRRLALTPYHVLHRFGIERRRADVVRRLAVVSHRLEQLVDLPLTQVYARLQSIPGIGPWTSARVGLIALGDPDAVTVGDLHIPHMVTWALAGERRGSDERMLELLEPYRGHRGRVIRLLMAGGRS